MNKKKYLTFAFTVCLFFVQLSGVFGQLKLHKLEQTDKRHTLKWAIGLGYEDGILRNTDIPSLGIAYEYALTKRFSFNVHLFSFYRAYPDLTIFNPQLPFMDKFIGSQSPFFTEAEKKDFQNRGLKALDGYTTFKMFSLPIDASITYYPLSIKHHRAGINLGLSTTYESHTWFRELAPTTIQVPSKNFQGDINFTLPTLYRNFSFGTTLKLLYEYHFDSYLIGTRVSSYNVFWDAPFDANLPIWETSIYFGKKF